ncbi:hypothetical protein Tco_0256511 [Tanacetum coccineum]
MSMEALQAQEDLMKSIESFLKKFNRISFGKTPKVLLQAWDNFFEVKHAQSEEVQELLSKLVQDVKIIILLYDNSSPRPPEALQANSNAIESLPPSHIPVADNDSLMEEIDLFLADDGSIPPGIESDDVDSVDDDTSISLPEFESFYVDYPNSGIHSIDVVEDIPERCA